MAENIDKLFLALHNIILSFIFRVGVFFPALTNAVLVGFAINAFAGDRWGQPAGLISGLVAGSAIEVGGVVLAWNMKTERRASWLVMCLYLIGSWLLIWLGLDDGLLTNVVGFIMPIFAVATQATISEREKRLEQKAEDAEQTNLELNQVKEVEELRLAQAKELTKQERAKARSASNLAKPTQEEVQEFLQANPDLGPTEAARQLGVTRQTIYRYKVKV